MNKNQTETGPKIFFGGGLCSFRKFTWRLYSAVFILVLILVPVISFAQQAGTVTGRVDDSTGAPLPGVTIAIKGTTQGTITNSDGTYSISGLPENATLVFSFVGMKNQEVAVAGQSVINVTMKTSTVGLDEVVAVGYGTTKKSDLTGAVASVKSGDLSVMSTQDALSAVQGKMAGVNITKQSGAPGAPARVRIRGIGTINNSDPIYVVDGFVVSDINYLSVNDIESVEVLKDASATAIYGSRGANGVILVTTKKGKKGAVQFSLNYNYGVQNATKKIDMLNAWQFATLYREAQENSGLVLSPTDDKITQYVIDHKYKGTDWQDEIFQKYTPVQNFDFSFSGSEGRNTYLASVFYNTNAGLVKYNDYSKLNVRLNNKYTISDKITWNFDVSYSKTDKHDINGGTLTSALYMDPITPAWDSNTNNYGAKVFNQIEATNPAMLVDNSKNNGLSYTNRFVANTALVVTDLFTKGLTFKSQFGYDSKTIKGKGYWPKYYISAQNYNPESSLYQNRHEFSSMLWSNYFTYSKVFGQHNIVGTAGMEMQSFKEEWMSGTVYDVPNDPHQMYFDLAQNLDRKILDGTFKESKLLSYFTRINYKFKDRYLLTATVRADGSSKFINENRWGFFPSAAVAWDIKKESFLQNVDLISDLKLRGGWGVVGNQNSLNNPYVYASTITSESSSYVLNGSIVNGYYPDKLANKDIKWETTETYNLGIDLALFNNRLTIDGNVFQNTTRDMIATPQAPMYAGYNAVPANIGSMRNKGIEVSVGFKGGSGEFGYNINWNITALKNEVLDLGTSTAIVAGMIPRLDAVAFTDVGGEIGAFKGLKTNGIFTQASLDALHAKYPEYQPTAQPGDVWFQDYNGDHKIDKVGDRQYLGSAVPDFTSGLNIQLNWRNFDFSCYLLGSYGNEIVNGQYVYLHGSNIKSNWSAEMWNRSHGDVITNVPRLDVADINGNTSTFSDLFVEDGSYLRLKNIQLGYSLPDHLNKKIGLTECRLYFSADNLYTLTKYSGWDPEPVSFGTLDGGVDYGTYPLSLVLSLGLNLKF